MIINENYGIVQFFVTILEIIFKCILRLSSLMIPLNGKAIKRYSSALGYLKIASSFLSSSRHFDMRTLGLLQFLLQIHVTFYITFGNSISSQNDWSHLTGISQWKLVNKFCCGLWLEPASSNRVGIFPQWFWELFASLASHIYFRYYVWSQELNF